MTQASALNPYKKAAQAQKEMQDDRAYTPAEAGTTKQMVVVGYTQSK